MASNYRPSMEEIVEYFIRTTFIEIKKEVEIPSFNVFFKEENALKEILSFIDNYDNRHTMYYGKTKDIPKLFMNSSRKQPTMIIKDYKLFFTLLKDFYIELLKLYEKYLGSYPDLQLLRISLRRVWLRMTPDDFNNPEQFLKKQLNFIKDQTFDKYDQETMIGFFNDYIITVKNELSDTWDETPKHFSIKIYSKDTYKSTSRYNINHQLPYIRYGIYEENGEKVCYIAAIQDKGKNAKIPKINRQLFSLNDGIYNIESDEYKRYKTNKDIYYPENISDVSPSFVFALAIFINLLEKEGIKKIVIPSMHTLFYRYHELLNKGYKEDIVILQKRLDSKKPGELGYDSTKQYLERCLNIINKVDLNSQNTTEKFMRTFRRIMYHYNNIDIVSYPFELDSFMHFKLKELSLDNINNEMLKEMWELVDNYYKANSKTLTIK